MGECWTQPVGSCSCLRGHQADERAGQGAGGGGPAGVRACCLKGSGGRTRTSGRRRQREGGDCGQAGPGHLVVEVPGHRQKSSVPSSGEDAGAAAGEPGRRRGSAAPQHRSVGHAGGRRDSWGGRRPSRRSTTFPEASGVPTMRLTLCAPGRGDLRAGRLAGTDRPSPPHRQCGFATCC
jgi:hypothetical protein